MGSYHARHMPKSEVFVEGSVSNGEYVFKVTDDLYPRMNTIIEYFYFLDADGVPLTVTAGTVLIQGSPDDGVTYQDLRENQFNASDCLTPSRTKPHGKGRLTHLKVTLSGGVTGAEAFKLMVTQETS